VTNKAGQHQRTSRFLLASFEKRVLPKMAAALPSWVMPDHLTMLGMCASVGIGASYLLTNRSELWLWAASGFLVVQWFGDSLDGSLARYRKIERPRYGFYLDHLTDAFSTVIIGLGLGLSPYMLLAVGLSIVIAYLVLSINVYLETHVFGEFSFGYGMLGPTEVRVVLLALNTTALLLGAIRFELFDLGMTVFDIAGMAASLGMLVLLLTRSAKNLRQLASLEPAGKVQKEPM
jgi:phosphatidylglycerophosphate synthase